MQGSLAKEMQSKIRIITLTEAGQRLAQRIQQQLPGAEIWFKPQPFAATVQQAFRSGDRLIFICATGIVIRTLAAVLQDKHQDPPVLVLDELGQFVIPLLSGHEGGANDWGYELAQQLDAKLVLTSAKAYLKPIYTVGMGCERDCPLEYLEELLQSCLVAAGLTIEQVHSIHSIDIKADETNLIALAAHYGKPFCTWSAAELTPMEPLLSTKSDYVFNTVGVYGVAESAALLGASEVHQTAAELCLNKHKNTKATCAIARSFPETK